MNRGLEPTPPESALAADVFQKYCAAETMNHILSLHGQICEILNLKPSKISDFYSKLKVKLANSWKAQALFKKLDLRAANQVYSKGNACTNTKVLIIGAGPCGLRAAIECQLLGAKVVICDKRDRFSRNNVLHLWPFTIHDLRALGAKKFFGKFCPGSIDHISIQRLQCILLKVALVLGVEFHGNISFEKLLEPTISANNEKLGWRALVSPADHPVGLYEFDVIMGANGNKRTVLPGFKHKVMRGRLAIAITANFINHNTEAEAAVQEISGITFIYNQTFFLNLLRQTGIDLENLVYYKDDTHYFVMTAKKNSLLGKGVLREDFPETSRLLSPTNINQEALQNYAREAAFFSTLSKMPDMQYALNHYGEPDVAIFDFTATCASENSSAVLERNGQKMLMCLIGDSLLEPFWPTGSGCARGFLSAMDACWVVRSFSAGHHPLAVIAERESIYRLLAQTTPENLHRDISRYTLEPSSRYPNLNRGAVSPHQVTSHYHTDDPNAKSAQAIASISSINTAQTSSKKRKRDSGISEETVLQWVRRTLSHIEGAPPLTDVRSALSGSAICALLQIYRPDLLASKPTEEMTPAEHAQWAYNVLHTDLLIQPLVTGVEITAGEPVDGMKMMRYLNSVYHAFKGEIPHVKHPDYEPSDVENKRLAPVTKAIHLAPKQGTKKHERSGSSVSPAQDSARKNRKRRSATNSVTTAERVRRIEELAEPKSHHSDRHMRRQVGRLQLYKSQRMLLENSRDEFEPLEEYCLQLYRQSTPCFKDRVNQLEQKLLYPDRATMTRETVVPGAVSIPDVGRKPSQIPILKKKPQDLLRAVGKLDTDWKVQHFEKKMNYIHVEKSPARGKQKVPKWSQDQFLSVKNKLKSRFADQPEVDAKFSKIDETIKKVEKQIKDGSNLELGIRGSNKVSDLAKQFTGQTNEESQPGVPDLAKQVTGQTNEESQSGHNKLDNREFNKTYTQNNREFNKTYTQKQPTVKNNELDNRVLNKTYTTEKGFINADEDITEELHPGLPPKDAEDSKDLDAILEEAKPCDEQDKPGQVEMDEEELNEHNFPSANVTVYLPCDEESEEESSSTSNRNPNSSCSEEYFSDKLDDAVDTSDSSSIEDSEALRIRHREIPRPPPPCVQSTTTTASETETDTEVESDWESSSDDARSGTEVSTDSEFAHDDPTLSPPPYAPPRITINDEHEADLHNYPEPAALFGMVKVCISGNVHNTRRHDRLDKEEIVSPKIVLKEPIKRPTEFSLSRTRSTSGIAAKRALELKKKYLLGDQSGLSIQKSDSASQLDSKFKSFQSNISEFQKLLNPGSDISPCMQAFLANSSKRNFPTSPSTSMFTPDPFKPEKEVEEVKLDPSIITEPMPDIIQNLYVRNNNIDDNKEENYEPKNLIDLLSKHNLDVDTNADPVDLSDKTVASDEKNSVLEQQLIVPDKDRDTRPFDETHSAMESDVESDSLLDSDDTEDQEVIHEASPFVPRVEVHDETGALMQPDSLMMVENEIVYSESLDEKVENVCESTKESAEEAQLSSYQESDDSANDVTALALTETELSDWAIDAAALEDYEDEDLKIYSSHKNLNRLKKTKDVHKTKNIVEAKHIETPHICGKDSGPKSMFAKAEEEFDFMDMGSQDSLIEATTSTMNIALLKNRGFLEFVDIKNEQSQYPKDYNDLFNSENVPSALRTPSPVNDRSMNFIEQAVCTIEDDGLPTPVSDQPNGSNDTPTSTSTEDSPGKVPQDTTESSSDNYNEPSIAQDSVIESTTDIPLPVVEFEKKFRIDPVTQPRTCQNISDLLSSSSDMHYYSKPDDRIENVNKSVKTENDIKTNLDKVQKVTKSPQTARRVEEIMKEKVKQKDLVREMVMDRLLANRLERRSSKRNRQSPDVADVKALKLVGKDNTVDSITESKETRLPDVSQSPVKSENVSFVDSNSAAQPFILKSGLFISKGSDVNGRPSGSAIPQLSRSRTDSDVRLNLASSARSKLHTHVTDESQVSSIKLLKHASGSKTASPPSPTYADLATLSETSKPNSMSDPNIPDSVHLDAKKTGKERRRSIIRTVSEFFNKRLSPKTKEVSKSCYGLEGTYDHFMTTPQKCQSDGDMQYLDCNRRPERPQGHRKHAAASEDEGALYLVSPSQKGSTIPPLPNTVSDLEEFLASLEQTLKRAKLEENEQETLATWFAARAKLASLRQSDQAAATALADTVLASHKTGLTGEPRRARLSPSEEGRARLSPSEEGHLVGEISAALADSVLASRQLGLVGELRRVRRPPDEETKLVAEILAVAAQRDSLAALYEKNKSRTINQKGCRGKLD